MKTRLIRRVPLAVVLAAAAFAGSASLADSAGYCDPLTGCGHLRASPGTVAPGRSVKLSGGVNAGCRTPARVTLYSRAFRGATRHRFRGTPAVYARARRGGAFSTRLRLSSRLARGAYSISGRCGRTKFASARLRVS